MVDVTHEQISILRGKLEQANLPESLHDKVITRLDELARLTDSPTFLPELDHLGRYVDWVVSQPQLDLPESSPRVIDLGDPEKLDMPENESLLDLMTMYELLEAEIGNSQSSRLGDSLISHDEKRFRDLIAKMRAFLEDYVKNILPLDLPESAPLRAQTGDGLKGV